MKKLVFEGHRDNVIVKEEGEEFSVNLPEYEDECSEVCYGESDLYDSQSLSYRILHHFFERLYSDTDGAAKMYFLAFECDVVGYLDSDNWTITSEEIEQWLYNEDQRRYKSDWRIV